MELNELDAHEKTVLVGALRLAVLADHRATEREALVIDRVARALGQAEYDAAMDRADHEAADGAALEALAATVTRSEARELIYSTVMEVALADSVTPGDAPLLDGLQALWGLTVKIAGEDEPTLKPSQSRS